MPESTVWRGTSSQWQNFGRYLFAIVIAVIVIGIFLAARSLAPIEVRNFSPFILVLLVVPIFMAGTAYLQTKSRIYELTTERIKTTEGIFSRVTDTLELYRVKDLETRQPFFSRLVGIENVQINTSDASSPVVWVAAIPSNVGLPDKIRNQVEAIRAQKGVREIDVE
jgi:uncharacterized membrane protein YdbT with pleckstrin-like domain